MADPSFILQLNDGVILDMTSAALKNALGKDLPVLFAHIGWARHYNGTEPIRGNFSFLQANPKNETNNWEAEAFLKNGGVFRCGIGSGVSPQQLHVVFVARDPTDQIMKVIGIYAAASATGEKWKEVQTANAELLPYPSRLSVPKWPKGRGVRRWAWRGGSRGKEHPALRALFLQLSRSIAGGLVPNASNNVQSDDEELDWLEGALRKKLVNHRRREYRLRSFKIREALRANKGRLICEVPRCGFDFEAKYGEVGSGYVQVHHKKPLGYLPKKGAKIKASELAVVCANCHAMIHRYGQCRSLRTLISK